MVTFRSENGMCPFYDYNGVRYYIQSEKNRSTWYDSEWTYELQAKKLDEKVHKFANEAELKQFIQSIPQIRELFRCPDGIMYKAGPKLFAVQGLKIAERFDYEQLSNPFETYAECLEFSKKYVQKVIDDLIGAGEQTNLFGGGT